MLEAKGLTKLYGNHKALNGINFRVDPGEIVGFLGPNGAGKTTTMNILTGYISATSGEVNIAGFDIKTMPEQAKKCIGFLPDTPPLYPDMRVDEYLSFVWEIKTGKAEKGLNKKAELEKIKEQVDIADVSRWLIKSLSKGYRQRVGIAQALIGNPKVLILDEPTTGLDPKQMKEIQDLILNLGKEHSVLFSSHNLNQVGEISDRVIIINKGNIIAQDTMEGLTKSLNTGNRMQIRVKSTETEAKAAFEKIPLNEIKLLTSIEPGTVELLLEGKETDIREDIFNCAVQNNIPILLMKSKDFSLEELFLQLTDSETEMHQENVEAEGAEEQ